MLLHFNSIVQQLNNKYTAMILTTIFFKNCIFFKQNIIFVVLVTDEA